MAGTSPAMTIGGGASAPGARPGLRRDDELAARTPAQPSPPSQPDRGGLLEDGAGGEALDLGQEGADAGAAVGAGQVEALDHRQQAGGGVGVAGRAWGGRLHGETPKRTTDPGLS